MTHDYRTPDEVAQDQAERAQVRELLRQITDDGTSAILAIDLHEPKQVVELWVDRVWNGLRDRLDDDQRLLALVMLLEPAMTAAARRIVSALAGPSLQLERGIGHEQIHPANPSRGQCEGP